MQKVKSIALAGIVVAVLCIIGLYAGQQVHAEQAEPNAATVAPAATPENGWSADKKYYYVNGTKVSGPKKIGNSLYYFDPISKGKRTSGVFSYNKKLYQVRPSGISIFYAGVYQNYYYRAGVKQTKYKNTVRKMSNSKTYYFKNNGQVQLSSGWKKFKGNRYYFKTGVALVGWNYVGQYKFYFNTNGVLCQDLIKKFGGSWKKTELLIKVNRKTNGITIYAKDGKRGYTIPVKTILCSVGKKATPTIKGTFTLKKSRTYRWGKLGGPSMGGYSYGQYCSRISGSFLFHSVLYKKPNKYTMSSAAYNNLGKAASHGCIRLQTGDAKLIYDIARYRNTTVTIFDGKSTGPFERPKLKKVKAGRNYDPTDPTI